ncbi:unnamed protein product [Nyctereutes procyonoides]|uniref:(raccoon dog) hypothetical protein n=1 Tax=Nyctereutes procyonoides TaxID=34880 RepID=A0A811Z8N5_NYCPR|nr:unnamed protein product [Nyctereutes procyonoides]
MISLSFAILLINQLCNTVVYGIISTKARVQCNTYVCFDFDGMPRLYQTDPSGTYHACKVNAIGQGAKSVREYLEKNYTDEAIETDDLTIKLVIKTLLEVVQSDGKNIELAVMRRDQPLKILNPEESEKYVAEIEKEK